MAREALAVAEAALPRFASRFSRKDGYPLPQLFAVLVVRKFLRQDYRGIEALLGEWSDLRAAIGLANRVPDHSTLCLAEAKLAERGLSTGCSLPASRGAALGLLDDAAGGADAAADAAVDSTGLETRHASAHFRRRCGPDRDRGRGRGQESWPKLTVALHTRTHLIAGALACRGPCQDAPQFAPVVRQAAANLRLYRVLADRGYDAEHCHALCRGALGVRTTAIPLNPRNHGRRWPKTRYRRLMKRHFPTRKYRQRAQAESGFSRHKRRLGSALTAKREDRQFDEMRLRVLTHNLMLLAAWT